MHWIDWTIVIGFTAFLTGMAIYCNRFMKSVASFLSAERCAGRYLLAVATGISAMGAISIIAIYEVHYQAGFVPKFWELIMLPISLVVVLTGWVIYRFRQTRAMTLAQFFEMRYSRSFRVYAGIVAFLSGIVNFGIFPSVGARFFIFFCDIPTFKYRFFDFYTLDVTYAVTMILLLAISLYFTFLGGQVAVIVTDFIQGTFFNLACIALLIFFFCYFSWTQVSESLTMAPAGESLVNPFDTANVKDFNLWYYLIMAFNVFYSIMAWQGSQAYNSSAKSPHEQKMAGVVGQWRSYVVLLLLTVAPIFMYVMMHHSDFAGKAAEVRSYLDQRVSHDSEDAIRKQMVVPVALRTILPRGFLGIMAAVMLAAFISTHDTYLHSWGVIFIQDVIMPFRKRPFTKDQHIRVLRWSIFGVAVFIFFFSLLFRHSTYILMFFAITGAIFLGGAGSTIIGGLYWKRGSTAAAFASLSTGAVLGVAGVILQNYWDDCPLNGQVMFFYAMLASILVYVVVSLLGNTQCNMDRLLHRGKYAIEEDRSAEAVEAMHEQRFFKRYWQKLITNEFTIRDKILYALTLLWAVGWFAVLIAAMIVHWVYKAKGDPLTDDSWLVFWRVWIWMLFGISLVITLWLLVGGLKDLFEMFAALRAVKVDLADDGWVEHSVVEEEVI